jgi:hypothetical protein
VKQSDFSVVKDGNDRHKSQEALREIEQKHGLQVVEKGHGQSADKGYAAGMRQKIDASLKQSGGNRQKFLEGCEQRGVKPILNESKTTGRISGISFQDGSGKVITGRDLGKKYSWHGLEKRLDSQKEMTTKASNKPSSQATAKPGAGGIQQTMGALKNPAGALKAAFTPKPLVAIKKLTKIMEM